MRTEESLIGICLINVASLLLAMNLFGWVCLGVSLRPFIWFLGLWLIGIIVAAIEPSCQGRASAKRRKEPS